ncbi:MAG: hypothetical protein IT326_00185 [Anaerolineae bacterium]|nr:hypothetical protein [Anaerolineae bacterium]
MSRVVNLNSPGKLRSQVMRTAGEIMRRLSQKTTVDDEVRDMSAFLVYCFREIDEGVNESVQAWEKRDYWLKAERFRTKWSWAPGAARELEKIVLQEKWELLPALLVRLLPYFDEVTIARFTRNPSLWWGAHRRLLQETVAS